MNDKLTFMIVEISQIIVETSQFILKIYDSVHLIIKKAPQKRSFFTSGFIFYRQ